jgi:hypothetical protein
VFDGDALVLGIEGLITEWFVTKVSLPLRQVGSVLVACGRLAIQPAALRFAPQQGPGIIVTDH